MMNPSLILAIPSKGRLEKETTCLFNNAHMTLKRNSIRGYQGVIEGMDTVEVIYLSASEIAKRLGEGTIHLGCTGEDLLREQVTHFEDKIHLISPLNFGHANVVVALPELWVDVLTMDDLAEVATEYREYNGQRLRIATKYKRLTQEFFSQHSIRDYQIIQSFGATEGAPASNAAEIIVDITSTGSTLAANQLRIAEDGIILRSQTHLVAALTADWTQKACDIAKKMLSHLNAYQQMNQWIKIQFIPDNKYENNPLIHTQSLQKLKEKYPLKSIDKEDFTFLVPKNKINDVIDGFMAYPFTDFIIHNPYYSLTHKNKLYETFIVMLQSKK